MSLIPLGFWAASGGGGGAGGFDLLETTTLTSSALSVTFSGLDAYSDYKHLQIRMVGRGDRATSLADLWLRFNSDSGSNYAWHVLYGSGSSVGSIGYPSQPKIQTGYVTGSTFTSNGFAGTVTDILDFSSTSKNTTIRSLTGMAGTNNQIRMFSGLWNSTSAVTSIQLLPEVDNLVAGSRFSLYGVK